jgi:hypothetical protein
MNEADQKKPVGKIFPKKPAVAPLAQKSVSPAPGAAHVDETKRPRIRIELPVRLSGHNPASPL